MNGEKKEMYLVIGKQMIYKITLCNFWSGQGLYTHFSLPYPNKHNYTFWE